MVSSDVTSAEAEQIDRLYRSLHDWALNDVRRAASPEVALPRLAFVGLAAWLDTVSLLYTGGKHKGQGAWTAFFKRYLPQYEAEAATLSDGLRNKLLHEYGTRGVALTHASPDSHWTVHAGLRVLDLHTLIQDCEAAFEEFVADIRRGAELRHRVLLRALGLLAPVRFEAISASASSGLTTLSVPGAIAASATGPPDVLIRDDAAWPTPIQRPEKRAVPKKKRRRKHGR